MPQLKEEWQIIFLQLSYDDLLAYGATGRVGLEPPLVGLQARVTVERLVVRSGPDKNYGDVGELREGDRVNVLSLGGDDVWIQIEAGKWIPFQAEGKRYLELE